MKKSSSSNGFVSLNQDNFHVKWEGIDFGLIAGTPLCSTMFSSKDSAKEHFILERQFLHGLLERVNRFIEVNEQKDWIDIRVKS